MSSDPSKKEETVRSSPFNDVRMKKEGRKECIRTLSLSLGFPRNRNSIISYLI